MSRKIRRPEVKHVAYGKRPYVPHTSRAAQNRERSAVVNMQTDGGAIENVKRAPSVYQQAILDAYTGTQDNLLIQARAGSGKTSTLVMLVDVLKGSGVFLAFNKSIAEELKKRLPQNVEASTFHALAFSMIRSEVCRHIGVRQLPFGRDGWVQGSKVRDIYEKAYGRDSGMELGHMSSAVCKLVSLMKNSLLAEDCSDNDVIGLIRHYGVDWEDDNVDEARVVALAKDVLGRSNADLKHGDFDDMLYLVWKLDVWTRGKYDNVLCDEAQDTNAAQREVLWRLGCGPGPTLGTRTVRLIAVGDEAQAIYGFRGADSDSMGRFVAEYGCRELPLSISYRCPKSVVKEAQQYVEDIAWADGAKEGTVRSVNEWALEAFEAGDLIVCRNNAPIVQLAYKLIGRRIACRVMGRDIGTGLISLIKRVCGREYARLGVDMVADKLKEWEGKEVSRLAKSKAGGTEMIVQSVSDKVSCITLLCEGMNGEEDKGEKVESVIADMFGVGERGSEVEGAKGRVCLSSVHKAKGMEARNVFVLDRGLMPSKYAKMDWQKVQERNLIYVAVTRSLDTLTYVDSADIG